MSKRLIARILYSAIGLFGASGFAFAHVALESTCWRDPVPYKT